MPSVETKSSLEKGGNVTSPLLFSQWVACVVPPVTHDRAHDLVDFRDGGPNIGMGLPRLPSVVETKASRGRCMSVLDQSITADRCNPSPGQGK
jgi:hypothetical protein